MILYIFSGNAKHRFIIIPLSVMTHFPITIAQSPELFLMIIACSPSDGLNVMASLPTDT